MKNTAEILSEIEDINERMNKNEDETQPDFITKLKWQQIGAIFHKRIAHHNLHAMVIPVYHPVFHIEIMSTETDNSTRGDDITIQAPDIYQASEYADILIREWMDTGNIHYKTLQKQGENRNRMSKDTMQILREVEAINDRLNRNPLIQKQIPFSSKYRWEPVDKDSNIYQVDKGQQYLSENDSYTSRCIYQGLCCPRCAGRRILHHHQRK